MNHWFHHFAAKVSIAAGHWMTFALAVGVVTTWFIGGFFVGFNNESYQLYINSGTTVVTFLMVFLIQHTQNVNDKALHKKLDELIRGIPTASNDMIGIEQEEEIGP